MLYQHLTLNRTCGNTFYNESGKKNVDNDDREDGKGDHYIHLSHVKLQEVCKAAEVDGATSSQIFRKITLPLLRPILIYVMITSLIGGMQMFDVPQILTNGTGDPMRSTMTLIMFLNKHLFSKNYGMGGALSVFLFIITGVLSLIVFRFNKIKD